ncbi:MAG: hypothetical protein KGR26_09805, partial [Cyanobacteria bacterium REEB65]|nr:hypothetical protein [Cyanobacteria bacterium REEB65]
MSDRATHQVTIGALLSAWLTLLLSSCLLPTSVKTQSGSSSLSSGASLVAGDRALHGTVNFPPLQAQGSGLHVQATAAQVVDLATVALVDVSTGNTLAAGQTDAGGNFTLAP